MLEHTSLLSAPVATPLPAPRTARIHTLWQHARHGFSLLGLCAVLALLSMFIRPELTERFRALSPFAPVEVEAEEATAATPPSLAMLVGAPEPAGESVPVTLNAEDKKLLGTQKQQQWVTQWLAKRYRVAGQATDMLVSAAYLTAREIKLDPLLILSVMAIESGFNPFAESPMGAQGLMQVMSKVHHDKFEDAGGVQAALNPAINIRVGSQILKDYLTRTGSLEAALKLYVGAAAFDNETSYGQRVLTEYKRLKDVSAGKRVPTNFATPPSTPAKKSTVPMEAQGKTAEEQLAKL